MIGLPNCDAFACVKKRGGVGGARHADRLGGDADAAALEVGERYLQPLTFLAEALVFGHAHVLEHQVTRIGRVLAELFLDLGDDEAGRVGRDDEGGNPLLAGVGVGDGEHDRHLSVAGPR